MKAEYLIRDHVHPERLPGEPDRAMKPLAVMVPWLVVRALLVGAFCVAIAPLWLLFLVGVAVWGYPPSAVRPGQAVHYLGILWHREMAPPGLSLFRRLWLTVSVVKSAGLAPVAGLAWFLDELIYGRRLAAVQIRAPIIKISAARSGSTQLAHYIEADPRVVSPTVLQIVVPYLWLWKLVAATLGRLLDEEQIRSIFRQKLPEEFLQRHEADPMRTDTFELGLLGLHLNRFAFFFDPRTFAEEFAFATRSPSTDRLWTETFADLLDGTCRKALLFAGAGPEARLFVKGHFLAAADTLAERYPDARFLTMIRMPSSRLQSMVNFLWCNLVELPIGKPPWPWIAEGLARTEMDYNRVEQAWFTRSDGPQRCVLRFTDYVRDLEGTMRTVYAACFDEETLPDFVPREHAPRERKNYLVDRSLAQLGIDGAAYEAAQPEFVAWCRGEAAAVDQSSEATGASG